MTEYFAHAQTVCTRPLSPGNEASQVIHAINHISVGYAGEGASEMNTCREPCGWFDLDHVSTSSIPSIVHCMVVEGGNGVTYTPTYFHVQCLLGVMMV